MKTPGCAVVGLGNPGARYAGTRHNIGFRLVDRVAAKLGNVAWETALGVESAQIESDGRSVAFVKPQSYMNRSGPPVREFLSAADLEASSILVIHDDLDLELGRIKLKRSGGTAGHRGLDSLVETLESDEFPRLRMGIGRPPRGHDVVDFVLENFTESEQGRLESILAEGVLAVGLWLESGMEAAMNRVNRLGDHLEPADVDC